MLTAQTINDVFSKIYVGYSYEVYVFDDYALLKTYETITYVSEDIVIYDYQVDIETICNSPTFRFWRRINYHDKMKEYPEPLTKKWATEYRLASMVYGRSYVSISDEYIIARVDYTTIWISAHEIYSSYCGEKRKCDVSIMKNNIVFPLIFSEHNHVDELPKVISGMNILCPKNMSHFELYTLIIKYRARGLHYILAFSDIIITHTDYEN